MAELRKGFRVKLISLAVCLLVTACATVKKETPPAITKANEPVKEESAPEEVIESKYKVGDCLMIVDLPKGETKSPYRVRVEKIEKRTYWYRWLLDGNEWAKDLSCLRNGHGPCGEFEALEKISQKVDDCPL